MSCSLAFLKKSVCICPTPLPPRPPCASATSATDAYHSAVFSGSLQLMVASWPSTLMCRVSGRPVLKRASMLTSYLPIWRARSPWHDSRRLQHLLPKQQLHLQRNNSSTSLHQRTVEILLSIVRWRRCGISTQGLSRHCVDLRS